jgi:hypothetical protein
MPALKNLRHEQFAQELVLAMRTGDTNGTAYSRAGYKATGDAARASAARMLADASNGVAARVQEIVGRGAKRAEMTVESLIDELDAVLAGARGDRQWAAAKAAIDSKARLKGMFVDRTEIGMPGEFAAMDAAQAIAQVGKDHGPEAARYLALAIEASAAPRQIEAKAVETVPARRSEADIVLEERFRKN